ncbi:unnamed protein product, partial [Prorocentrum cordatum]
SLARSCGRASGARLRAARPARAPRPRAGAMEPPRPDGDSKLASVEQWRLDYETGGPGAVHVSEFAEIRAASPSGCELGREAYGRPTNRRAAGSGGGSPRAARCAKVVRTHQRTGSVRRTRSLR